MIGKIISHYRILEHLGSGDRFDAYVARDLRLDRVVAIKFLVPGQSIDSRTIQECLRTAREASALDHPNIAPTHDIGQFDDESSPLGDPTGRRYFIVIPWSGGESVQRMLRRGPLKIERAIDIAIAVAEGLSRAHAAGMVHGDIRPGTILVTPGDGVKITEFGLLPLTRGLIPDFTPFMSPEQVRRRAPDARSDIWALGAVLYEMVTGTPPFRGTSPNALKHAILHRDPTPPQQITPDVPEALAQIIRRALSRNRTARYQTASAFAGDLRLAREGDQTGTITQSGKTAEQKRKRRRLVVRTAVAGGSLLLILAALHAIPPMFHERFLASHPKTILITSFANHTGIDSLDYFQIALQHQLITSLEQSVYFRPTSWSRLADLKRQVNRPDALVIDDSLGRELCLLDGDEAMLTGSIERNGDRFTLIARLVEPKTRQILMAPMASGRGIESFFDQVDQLSRAISLGVGISARRTDETLRPIEEISTRSQLAYQHTITGWERIYRGRTLEALRDFEMAVNEDSLFYSPWIGLRLVYQELGDLAKARHASQKLISLFSRASERDKLVISPIDTSLRTSVMGRPGTTLLDLLRYQVTRFPMEKNFLLNLGIELQSNEGSVDEAIDLFERSLKLDPQFGFAMSALARAHAQKGEFSEAMQVVNRYASLSPANSFPYHVLGDVYIMAGRYDDAIASYVRARALEPGYVEHTMKIARTCFWREQYDDALRWLDSASASAPSPGKKAELLWSRAFCMYWLGRLGDAEVILRKRAPLLSSIGDQSDGFLEAWIALDRGQYAQCRSLLHTWITRVKQEAGEEEKLPGIETQYQFCLGSVDFREGRLDSLEARLPVIDSMSSQVSVSDTSLLAWETREQCRQARRILMSEVLLARGRPAEVPRLFPTSARGIRWDPLLAVVEPGWRGITKSRADIPVETDCLARAYAALNEPDSAIAVYETSITIGNRRWGVPPRLHYRLARLYEQKGLNRMAIIEYEKFLKFGGKADPIFPEPVDARKRLEKLRKGKGSFPSAGTGDWHPTTDN